MRRSAQSWSLLLLLFLLLVWHFNQSLCYARVSQSISEYSVAASVAGGKCKFPNVLIVYVNFGRRPGDAKSTGIGSPDCQVSAFS